MTAAPAQASIFAPLSVRDLAALPAPEWLAGNLLPAGGLGMLFAESGGGKTILALDLALSISAGLGTWFGRPLQEGDAVYAAGEGLRSLSMRIEAWRSRSPGADLRRFSAVRAVPHLATIEEVAEFVGAIESAGITAPKLVVIDTLARATTGRDENDAAETGVSIVGLDYIRDALGCAVLVIHHAGWAKGRERGSTALRAACDTVLSLEQENGLYTLRVAKQRDGEVGKALTLRLKPAAPAVVFESTDERILTPRQLLILETLAGLDGRATFTDWVEKSSAPRSTTTDAINALTGMRLVTKSANTYTLTDAGREQVRRSK